MKIPFTLGLMSFRDIWPWPTHTKVQTLGLKKAFPLGLVIHDNQIIGVGERRQRRRTTTITTTTTGRARIRAIGDVLSLCPVMIGMTQQNYIYLFYII
jgi:hypothetical protein